MSDDLLRRAATALREEHDGDDASARFTRTRVLAGVSARDVRRRTRLALGIPLGALLAAATAFGAATGDLGGIVARALEAVGVRQPAGTPASPPAGGAEARDRSPEPPAPSVTAPPVTPEPAEAARPRSPQELATEFARDAGGGSVAVPRRAPSSAADPAHDLYREAHRLHFGGGSPADAVAAWDAYLARAPSRRLALEARYNRALGLVRLGRRDEALRALTPFAEAPEGAYRQAEARALVEALAR